MTATGRSQSALRATMFYLTGRWPRLWPITRLVNGSASGGHKANETRETVKCHPLWSSAERGAFLRLWTTIWSGLSDCLRHSVRVSTDKCHGLSGRHCSDCARHPRRDPPIASATAMRVTAVHAQTERKRQDKSARSAEKRWCHARKRRLPGLIRPIPAACATADAGRGEKCLSSGQNQVILTSVSMPLGECRLSGPRKG